MTKMTGHQQVVEFMNNLEHPLKKEIEEVREIILSVNDQITEIIKWKAPSFCYNGEDRVTFNLQGKGFFRLIFHAGAKVKKYEMDGNLFEDHTGLLEWVAVDRAIVKIFNSNDLEEKKAKLKEVITRWLDATS